MWEWETDEGARQERRAAYALRGVWCQKYLNPDGRWVDDLAAAARYVTVGGLLVFLQRLTHKGSGFGALQIVQLTETTRVEYDVVRVLGE
jgi:hypothetical protein